MKSTISYSQTESPLGAIWIAATPTGLCCIGLGEGQPDTFFTWISRHLPDMPLSADPAVLEPAAAQLDEYLAGRRQSFDLAIDVHGTPFQNEVWTQLMGIPYGSTVTYGQIARRIGRPTASRAVGAAIGANPLPIVIPCHRVIGSKGALVGYGGGLKNKETLLKIERDQISTIRHAAAEPAL